MAHEGVAVFLLLDRVVPVESGLQQLHPPAQVQYDILTDVGGTGLEQSDPDGRVLAQPGSDGGSGRSAADDDIVEGVGGLHDHSCPFSENQPVTAGSVFW